MHKPRSRVPTSSPVTISDERVPIEAPSRTTFFAELRRIVLTEGLRRARPRAALVELAYLVAIVAASIYVGMHVESKGSMLERIADTPALAWLGVAFVAYEALVRIADVVQDDNNEFDRAVKTVTYPIRLGIPVAALGVLFGIELTRPEGQLPISGAVFVICVLLFALAALLAAHRAVQAQNR